MRMSCHRDGASLRLKPLTPRLDAERVDDFKSALLAAGLDRGGSLVLDLGDLRFVDSSGLGALVWAAKRARRAGGRLGLVGVRGAVEQVLRLTRLDRVLLVERDAEAEAGGLPAARA